MMFLGGGGAITTTVAEYYSDVFSHVVYNELNPAVYSLFSLLINGSKKEKATFFKKAQKWVSREDFNQHKGGEDVYAGYIQTCWSFGNNLDGYLYGRSIEAAKELAHAVIYGELERAKELPFKLESNFINLPIQERRLSFNRVAKKLRKDQAAIFSRVQHIERMDHLRALETLGDSIPSGRIRTSNRSYEEVQLTPASVVYIDPPYFATASYVGKSFDYTAFKEWVCLFSRSGRYGRVEFA